LTPTLRRGNGRTAPHCNLPLESCEGTSENKRIRISGLAKSSVLVRVHTALALAALRHCCFD
jgi:hypothetical protein